MVLGTIRLFAGNAPSPRLTRELQNQETCFARFAADPDARLWVCARVGSKVYGTVLGRDEEWLQPAGGSRFTGVRPHQPTRRLAKAA